MDTFTVTLRNRKANDIKNVFAITIEGKKDILGMERRVIAVSFMDIDCSYPVLRRINQNPSVLVLIILKKLESYRNYSRISNNFDRQ